MDLTAELGKIRLLEQLSPTHLAKLARIAREHTLNVGDILFKEGDPGNELVLIAMGTLAVEKATPSGELEEIASLGSGSALGEVGILSGAEKRVASARATDKTFVISLPAEDVEELVAADPELGISLYRALAEGLALRVTAFAGETAHYRALALKRD